MKDRYVLTYFILMFWFVWFSIGGIAIMASINWIFSANYGREEVLEIGATIGIITGGIAALMFYVLGKTKKLSGFGESFNRLRLKHDNEHFTPVT